MATTSVRPIRETVAFSPQGGQALHRPAKPLPKPVARKARPKVKAARRR